MKEKEKVLSIEQIEEDLLSMSNMFRGTGNDLIKDLIFDDIKYALLYHGVSGLCEVITYTIQNVKDYKQVTTEQCSV